MDEARILVTGSTGQVGTALREVIPTARFVDRMDFDLADLDAVDPFLRRSSPSAVINCAAYTAVDAAEGDEATATTINGAVVGAMAATCGVLGIPFVTYSTDYVFDGTKREPYLESDPTCPINAYGRSKLAGEGLALRYPTSLVIRTSWVISGTHDNFVSAILRRARAGPVRVVDDQMGKPTIASDLAAATVLALRARASGLMHIANPPAATWFDIAACAVRAAGLGDDVVHRCATSDYSTKAERPQYSVLESSRSDTPRLPSWMRSINEVAIEQMRRLGDR